jgi:16S rRNA (guanine527-N7)-methyltransferase
MSSSNKETQPSANSWRIAEWFPDLDPQVVERLKGFFDELLRFNATISLISPKTVPFADAIHFADSINGCRLVFKDLKTPCTVFDFGSGNGFPGIVFGIMYPDFKVVLVDSDPKKIEFLKHTINALKLTNITTAKEAVEALPEGCAQAGLARGFGTIPKSLIAFRKACKKGGKIYHFKSEEWATEIAQMPTQLCSFWTPSLVGEYKLPVGSVKFAVVKTDKIA